MLLYYIMAQTSLSALVTMVTLVSCDVISHQSTVLDRLDMMEQQLRYQNDVIQNQAVRLTDLDYLNRRLLSKISEQDARLSQHDARFSEQEKTIRLQSSKLFRQEDKLTKQERMINQQSSRISQQDKILTNLLAMNLTSAMSLKSTSPQSLYNQDSGTSVTSTHHDVIARSDDTGALGVVVNEMNQRVTQMSADIQALKTTDIKHASDIQALKVFHISDMHALTLTNQHQDQDIHDARSSSFVRWGSSHCPHNSSLVYSGIVGGSLYSHPGAAVNYLCLTMSPVFGNDRSLTYYALLYGGEYSTFDSNQDRNAVCAVCRASFSTTIMIPGTNVCTSGWTPLYSGYLMAGRYEHKAAREYVCVDAALESSPGTAHDDIGAMLYFTKTRCGSLPCGPYVNDKVVTCVVCGQ